MEGDKAAMEGHAYGILADPKGFLDWGFKGSHWNLLGCPKELTLKASKVSCESIYRIAGSSSLLCGVNIPVLPNM